MRITGRSGSHCVRMGPHYLRTDREHPGWTRLMRMAKAGFPPTAVQSAIHRSEAVAAVQLDVQSLLRASNPQFAIMPILCVIWRAHQRIFHLNLRPWNRKSSKNSDPGSTLVTSKWSLARVQGRKRDPRCREPGFCRNERPPP